MAYASITKPEDYFNTKLYTGNGSTNAITGVGFQPDLVWLKKRDGVDDHYWFDVTRGTSKYLISNQTASEGTNANTLSSFDSDGFTLGSDGGPNSNANTYASWNWLAGGTASSNTDGSITSTVSANTTSGFSVVSYTGTAANATVGHGLGSAPNVIFFKSRSNSSTNWYVYHSSLGQGTRITLNSTGASASDTEYMNNTAPTSSVFSLGANGTTNPSSANQIAYCFAEKKGYSKFGIYTGNGNTDGAFVYTGFKPAFTMVKRTDGVGDWIVMDTKRSPFNLADNRLIPNVSNAEQTSGNSIDILSNGFKNRTSDGYNNASGGSFIYMAFAEEPLVANVGNSIPATAR